MLLALLATLACWIHVNAYVTGRSNPGCIVMLCGTSSVGKSSTIRAFMNKYGNEFYALSSDEYLIHLPQFPQTKSEGKKARNNFYKQILELSKTKHVIVDMAFINDLSYKKFFSIVNTRKTLFVLLYCPLEIILERIMRRNIEGKAQEKRSVLLVIKTLPLYYKIAKHKHESIDLFLGDDIVSVLQRGHLYDMESVPGNTFSREKLRKKWKKTGRKFLKHFDVHRGVHNLMAPHYHYNVIINSKDKTSEAIAEQIFDKLKENRLLQ